MTDIVVNDLFWASSMLPEGLIERWLAADGAPVAAGDAIAEVEIEDAHHDLLSPATGRLEIYLPTSGIVSPGCVVGRIVEQPRVA